MRLIFGVSKAIRKIREPEKVCYLGYNFSNQLKLIKSGFNVIDIKNIISDTAHSIKYKFIDYIADIGKKQKRKLEWWASSIASKSNLQTDFFANTCLLFAFSKIKEDNICSTIVVDDMKVYYLLKANYKFDTFHLSDIIAIIDSGFKKIYYYFKVATSRLKFILYRLNYNRNIKNIFTNFNGRNVYVYSWVEDRSFNSNGNYSDPYFPGIYEFNYKSRFITFCSYYVKKHLFKNFSDEVFLDGLPNYSSIKKIIFSCFHFFRPKMIDSFCNLNLYPLWDYEILSENSSSGYIAKIHDYYCWEDFFRSASGLFIYPYENQPWEKVMIQAANKVECNVKLVGCLHTTVHRLLLAFHTTKNEISYMPTPGLLVVNSEYTKNLYNEYYKHSSVKIINGGSLRFSSSVAVPLRQNSKVPTVGVMLSCVPSQTYEQLNDLKSNNNAKFIYLVKMHPDLPIKQGSLSKNIKFYTKSALELYHSVDGIIYCSSTSGMEAYSLGLPVFRLLTQYLDLETGEDSFFPNIIKSISEISESDLVRHEPIQLFSPVNEKVWMDILS